MAAMPNRFNIDRFSGFADTYDSNRPQPPVAVIDILNTINRTPRPAFVVDIGSGTGLSTRLWSGRAERIVGIEPNADMRAQAAAATSNPSITYQDGTSTATRLPHVCADVVTCSQCLHWMEPEPTFAEIARILRPGGVFAAIDCDWPPTIGWEMESAYRAFLQRVHAMEGETGLTKEVHRWAKESHLARMEASGRFRYTKEVLMHHVESGNAARLVGLAKSFGGVATLLRNGISEERIGLTALRKVAEKELGDGPRPWYFSYRVRIGIR